MKSVKAGVCFVVLAAVIGLGVLYSGIYPMGADVPHNRLTFWVLETLRERSIARASADIVVPPLGTPAQLLAGGADYNAMCATCHLKPAKTASDFSVGLYPVPPNLSMAAKSDGNKEDAARRQFWIIKHGIKASGMPAWGKTHEDARIWAMVAFLQRLPELTPVQYQIITAQSGDEHVESSEHH